MVTLSLENSSPDVVFSIDDGDTSPLNETITNLSLSENSLIIDEGGFPKQIDLTSLKEDENWTKSGNNISNSNSGNVGIKEANPTSSLFVNGSMGAKVRVESSGSGVDTYSLGDEYIFIGIPDGGDLFVLLPNASNVPGRIYIVKKGVDSNKDVYLIPDGSQTIDGESFYELTTYVIVPGNVLILQSIMVVSDGSNWFVLNSL